MTGKPLPALQLLPHHQQIITDILQKHLPGVEVWAFGSRVAGTARPYSDLDLVVINDKPLSLQVHADVVDAFTQSDLPYPVDLVEWAQITPAFRAIISGAHAVLQHA